MPASEPHMGRRERNKQQKLERIMAAASKLFAERGVDDVTTQQIADAADIGTGTLFLYAKTKGELLLLVQNANYAAALDRGHAAASAAPTAVDAVMAYLRPIIECNRTQVENGRTYLREMVFGDPAEPHHAAALEIVARTETSIVDTLTTRHRIDHERAATIARISSAIMYVTLSASTNIAADTEVLFENIRRQIATVLTDVH
ncbi:TetR/AcrR family transcriptional regulator [Microbacterium terricola]